MKSKLDKEVKRLMKDRGYTAKEIAEAMVVAYKIKRDLFKGKSMWETLGFLSIYDDKKKQDLILDVMILMEKYKFELEKVL